MTCSAAELALPRAEPRLLGLHVRDTPHAPDGLLDCGCGWHQPGARGNHWQLTLENEPRSLGGQRSRTFRLRQPAKQCLGEKKPGRQSS